MNDELARLRKEQVEQPHCYCGNKWMILNMPAFGYIRFCANSSRAVSFCNALPI